MSRETVGGGGDAPARTRPPDRRVTQVLRMALATLLVAGLAGALATVAEQRRAQAEAAADVRLLGAFEPGGFSVRSPATDGGVARINGRLTVVNAGTYPVELTGATVSGVPVSVDEPQRVEPGETVQVPAAVELPCSRPADDVVQVDLRVVSDGGTLGRQQGEPLTRLPADSSSPLGEHLTTICTDSQALAVVTHLQVDADGTVVVDLRSLSKEVQVRVLLAPRMGALVNGGASVHSVIPAGGLSTLLLDITIEDCERARRSVGSSSYDVLMLEAGVGQPVAIGRLDGWNPSVGVAAFGFALARQC